MRFFILLLVLGQLFNATDADVIRMTEEEYAERILALIFPLPQFGPLEGRLPRIGMVRRFNQYGPPCGHGNTCDANESCVCCGLCLNQVCKEAEKTNDYCTLHERIDLVELLRRSPKQQNYGLPADFPDVKM